MTLTSPESVIPKFQSKSNPRKCRSKPTSGFDSRPLVCLQSNQEFARVVLQLNAPLCSRRRVPIKQLVSVLIKLQTFSDCPNLMALRGREVNSLVCNGHTLLRELGGTNPVSYLQKMHLDHVFPAATRLLTGDTVQPKLEKRHEDYGSFVADISQLVSMAEQMLTDLAKEGAGDSEKYMAHQLASLYSCLSLFAHLRAFRMEIREYFNPIKICLMDDDNCCLTSELRTWLSGFLTTILSYVSAETPLNKLMVKLEPVKLACGAVREEALRYQLVRVAPSELKRSISESAILKKNTCQQSARLRSTSGGTQSCPSKHQSALTNSLALAVRLCGTL